jgi:YXWGXW repeat-containing protein
MMRKFPIHSILLTLFMLAVSAASFGQVSISVVIAPPPLPVYVQPVCPGEGYIWTPGYWAWDPDAGDYYWVPGTWVLAPEVGFFWTPGYWGWGNGFYIWHWGYWGPHVGFYGGINYGFGYFGHGYYGGRWEGGHFFYNREVNNVNVIHNVYNEHVDVREVTHVSYNGGNGGINERPTREEEAADRDRHIPPVTDQVRHEQTARSNRDLRASYNHGKPPIAATPRPGAFNEHEVSPAKEAGGPYNPLPKGGASRDTSTAIHPKELPPYERPAAPNTGNAKLDQKYQQQQEKLAAKQEQDRLKLQQKQDQEHQRLTQQHVNEAKIQQTEQKHQQQTQQMVERHTQQQQNLQIKQQPSHQGGGKPH